MRVGFKTTLVIIYDIFTLSKKENLYEKMEKKFRDWKLGQEDALESANIFKEMKQYIESEKFIKKESEF
jgi:hypothetical protein